MPISRQEFESTLDRAVYLTLEFLPAHVDAAYTASEVRDALAEEGIELSGLTLLRRDAAED